MSVSESTSTTTISSSPPLKLSGRENYNLWCFIIVPELKRLKCWDESRRLPINSDESTSTLLKSIENDVIEFLMDCKNAQEMWKTLQDLYAKRSTSMQIKYLKEMISFNLTDDHDSNLKRYKEILRNLEASVGYKDISIKDLGAINFLFLHHHQEFAGVKAVIENETNLPTLTEISNRFSSISFHASAKLSFKNASKKNKTKCTPLLCQYKEPAKCWNCHPELKPFCKRCDDLGQKSNHEENGKFCPNKGKISLTYANLAFATNDYQIPREVTFLVDSGASNHMSNEVNLAQEITPDTQVLQTASRSTIKMEGCATLEFENYRIKNVLMSSELSSNLLSVSKLADNGFISIFNDEKWIAISKNKFVDLVETLSKHSIIQGVRTGSLYSVSFKTPLANKVTNENDLHLKFGHSSHYPLEDCKSCIMSKSKRSEYPLSSTKTSRIGELIHIDTFYMPEVSIQGSQYFLLIIDDFSRYNCVYGLKRKSDASEHIKSYVNMIESKFSLSIDTIRSDNAPEFKSEDLLKFYSSHGISHQTSCSYTPQQNGKAERWGQTIINMMYCMLLHSGFPNEFWEYAIHCASFTTNVVPTKSLDSNQVSSIPYEIWNKKAFDPSRLVIFGQKAYVHIPSEKRKRLTPKAEERYFISYGESFGSKGYCCVDLSDYRVQISNDVKFVKTEFPSYVSLQRKSTYVKDSSISENSSQITVSTSTVNESISEEPSESSVDFQTSQESSVSEIAEDSSRIAVSTSIVNESINEEPRESSADRQTSQESSVSEDVPELHERARFNIDSSISEDNILPFKLRRGKAVHSVMCLKAQRDPDVPKNLEEISTRDDKSQWLVAIESEMTSLTKHKAWKSASIPKDRKAISTKWIFKIKRNADNSVLKYKARLVARGFDQVDGLDFNSLDIYAPVAKHTSLRTIFSIAATDNLELHQVDVETAFLLGNNLEEEVYLRLPDGSTVKLLKSFYGLKQAPKVSTTHLVA